MPKSDNFYVYDINYIIKAFSAIGILDPEKLIAEIENCYDCNNFRKSAETKWINRMKKHYGHTKTNIFHTKYKCCVCNKKFYTNDIKYCIKTNSKQSGQIKYKGKRPIYF